MGRYIKLLIILFSISGLYCAYYFGIPAIINIPAHETFIQDTIFNKTGYKVNIKKPNLKMGIIPSLWLDAENIRILNDDNSEALNIDNPKLNIKLIPLICKNIKIDYFYANNLRINLILDKDNKLKIGQYEIKSINKDLPYNIQISNSTIGNYKINLLDKIQNKQININGKTFNIEDFIQNKYINLYTDADITTGEKKASICINTNIKFPLNKLSENQFSVDGHIINLDLSDFTPYAKALSKNKIDSVSGIVNFVANTYKNETKHNQINTKLYLNNFGIYTKSLKTSIYKKGKLKILTDLSSIENGIEINDMKIEGKGISSFMSGEITKLNSKIPDLNLSITVNNSKAEDIIPLLPPSENLSPDINLLLLKQTNFVGDAIGNLELKGKADFPKVYGKILVSNAFLVKPIPNCDKGTIKLIFKGDKMDLDVDVPTSKDQKVLVKGPITLEKERYADLYIKSTDSVDLKTAQIVLNPLHDILRFDLGPVPIMDIQGKGGIDLHIVGTKKNPHGWGQFWFNNATVSFNDIKNLVIKNGSGTLDFDNQNTIFKSKTANLNGKPVSIEGTCSLLGVLNFKVLSNGQDIGKLLTTIKTSPMLKDIQKLTEQIETGNGPINLSLNLTGKVKDPKDIVFNKNLFANGNIKLLSNSIKLKNAPLMISKLHGDINLNNLNANFKLISNFNKSILNINGEIKDNNLNTEIHSNKFNIGDGISTLPNSSKIPYIKDLSTISSSFIAKYNGSIENINYDNIYIKGNIYPNKGAKSSIIINQKSSFELKNSNFKLSTLQGVIKNSPYKINANIRNIFDKNRIVNGECKINSLDLNLIHDNAFQLVLSPKFSKELKKIDIIQGKINIASKIKNNNINVFTILNDVQALYKPKHLKLTINSGNIFLQNNNLNINKINSKIGDMPLFINGKIANIYKNPQINLYLNTKPSQEFLDQFFNNEALYPIKLKGDLNFTSKIQGNLDNLNSKSILNIAENSSLYYMGATIGDIENPVKITLDNNYSKNKLHINNFKYDKIIHSQNNKPFVNTQLNASGTLELLKNNIVKFNNFKIKTETPTDAKIFNIIFRKPFMKQGVFTSDLILTGSSVNPKIKGNLNITSIDIPFFDSTIRDINLKFKNDKIYATTKGTVLTNELLINAIIKNKLTTPYIIENIDLKLTDLNVNKITDTLRDIEAEATRNPYRTNNSSNLDINQLIIENANIEAKKIKIRNINANNFNARLSLDKKQNAIIRNFKFNIAEGSVLGNLKYNLKNKNANLNVNLNKANALIMSEALFDLKGQVYGSVNGEFNLSCQGSSQTNCFRTLNGGGKFEIANGRMPKLGSLEYLLKAGNLLTGGVTGISINSLIDLVTPLKTGDFDSIYGDIQISNGTADKINVYSNGNDLNMYMTGSYNLLTSVADMKIYGSLSKNITNVFGKIKNASLNTLFNTIPGISDTKEQILLQTEISKIPSIKDSNNIYRIFFADINGDINGENYVKSFKWVK